MQEKISKKIIFSNDVYKILKKTTVDLNIDGDGKFTPEALGEALEYLLIEKKKDEVVEKSVIVEKE